MKGTDSKKVLLMGRSGSGKTSMRSIIFADYLASDTTRLSPTIDVEYSHVRFLGDLHLHLWDCGGQDEFFKSYLSSSKRDHVFKSVELLIYVFDVSEIKREELEKDVQEFCDTLNALEEHSPDARVFVLIHKMDLVKEEMRQALFEEREKAIVEMGEPLHVECFATSIWDETLYRAWSTIVYSLVPNTALMETRLSEFCHDCGADEVVLFESTTFLVIAQAAAAHSAPHPDNHRFEKISNIIKQFKLSCRKAQAQFESMQVQTADVSSCVFSTFSDNTTIMIVASDPHVHIASLLSYVPDLRNELGLK